MPKNNIEQNEQFNLIGTSFVKMFREYLISLSRDTKGISEDEIIKKAYLEKNVKPETTRRYIRELKEMDLISI